jgi:hypothetical protein
VADAVILLVGTRQFVAADDVPVVFVATGHGHETDLGVHAHLLAVEMIGGGVVLTQGTGGDQRQEVFAAPGVNRRIVRREGGREVDFRF